MNFPWYARRLSRMTLAEVLGRAQDVLIKHRWRSRQVRNMKSDPLVIPHEVPPFSTPLPPLEFGSIPEKARTRTIRAADDLLSGRWQVFDYVLKDMALMPDWFFDPHTERRAPKDDYAFHICHRRVEEGGTIKYVWELSRHHHLTLLAAAYYVTGNARYADCVARHLHSWWEANPFLTGVHWTSGIELGVRLIAWVWIRRLLDRWDGVRALFDENRVFLQQLHHHQDYLAKLSSHGSSANNHILAEMAGQFAACCAFQYFPETPDWRKCSAAVLRRELPLQTFPCGLNRELATGYHGFVLELCIAAALEGEAAGQSLGPKVWETIRRMTDALAAVLDAKLRPPRQGDSDDGQGLLLDAPDFDRWSSLLATGHTLFGAREWWPDFPQDDLRTVLWTQLAPAPRILGRRPDRRPSLFPDAGLAIFRNRPGTENEIWCRCDHGPHGYLSIAAHAHADALSLELRYGGVDVLSDPGTYTYQGEPEWRAYFRSTIGHNSLEIAGASQSVSGGPFMWTRFARSKLVYVSGLDEGPIGDWCATHDGYQRLHPPAIHQRSVMLKRDAECIIIDDSVQCKGQLSCCLVFHLGPKILIWLNGSHARLSWKVGDKGYKALISLPNQLKWTTIRGQLDPPLGWYSPSFRVKTPSTTLIGRGKIGGGDQLITEISFSRGKIPEKMCESDAASA